MNKKEAIAKVLSLVVPRNLKGCAAKTVETDSREVCVLYLGTATYDLPQPKERQTVR